MAWHSEKLGATSCREDPRLAALIDRVRTLDLLEFAPWGLANPAWAIAVLRVNDSPWMDSIAAASIALCFEFNTQQLTSLAWSFAKIE